MRTKIGLILFFTFIIAASCNIQQDSSSSPTSSSSCPMLSFEQGETAVYRFVNEKKEYKDHRISVTEKNDGFDVLHQIINNSTTDSAHYFIAECNSGSKSDELPNEVFFLLYGGPLAEKDKQSYNVIDWKIEECLQEMILNPLGTIHVRTCKFAYPPLRLRYTESLMLDAQNLGLKEESTPFRGLIQYHDEDNGQIGNTVKLMDWNQL